ncbi:MAG: SHOCT domain-containing protein [Devosia sp.]|jgi:hypothetical protein
MITRRPSLLGRTAKTVARTAVIAGTATAVSGRVAARQAGGHQPAGTEPAAQGLAPDALDQLKKLAELHAAGVLTDEEFATQKARLLS